jgi:hypothetical protein
VDIRFDADQTASFMEKMKTIFPVTGSGDDEPEDDPQEGMEPEVEAVSDSVPSVETPEAHGQQTLPAPTAAPSSAAPCVSLDIAHALAALAKAAGAPQPPAGAGTVRISQEGDDYRLSVPKPAVELLKGLRPILEALLKLGT